MKFLVFATVALSCLPFLLLASKPAPNRFIFNNEMLRDLREEDIESLLLTIMSEYRNLPTLYQLISHDQSIQSILHSTCGNWTLPMIVSVNMFVRNDPLKKKIFFTKKCRESLKGIPADMIRSLEDQASENELDEILRKILYSSVKKQQQNSHLDLTATDSKQGYILLSFLFRLIIEPSSNEASKSCLLNKVNELLKRKLFGKETFPHSAFQILNTIHTIKPSLVILISALNDIDYSKESSEYWRMIFAYFQLVDYFYPSVRVEKKEMINTLAVVERCIRMWKRSALVDFIVSTRFCGNPGRCFGDLLLHSSTARLRLYNHPPDESFPGVISLAGTPEAVSYLRKWKMKRLNHNDFNTYFSDYKVFDNLLLKIPFDYHLPNHFADGTKVRETIYQTIKKVDINEVIFYLEILDGGRRVRIELHSDVPLNRYREMDKKILKLILLYSLSFDSHFLQMNWKTFEFVRKLISDSSFLEPIFWPIRSELTQTAPITMKEPNFMLLL